MHNNFESVFDNFPNRIVNDTHGYVATASCSDIGKRGILIVDNAVYNVAVADCLNPKEKPLVKERFNGKWVADVDEFVWYASSLKRTHYGTLCLFTPQPMPTRHETTTDGFHLEQTLVQR